MDNEYIQALRKEVKKEFPEAVVVVSVVTATGHAMAHRIIPEAEGIIFFPFSHSQSPLMQFSQ